MKLRDARGEFRLSPDRLLRAVVRRVQLPVNYARLKWNAAHSARSVVDPASGVVVSMTTHGERLETVHLTIQSIAQGTVRPSRLVLALDSPLPDELPQGLQRMVDRGVEIVESAGRYGPHTKYYPYLCANPESQERLVTADDDVIYPRTWLEDLRAASDRHPGDIIAHRCHRIGVTSVAGRPEIRPYNSWEPCRTTEPSHLNFLTGVSGVLYPIGMQRALVREGERFQDVAPKADDVWLNWVAMRAGVRVRQVRSAPQNYSTVMSTQRTTLLSSNVQESANDLQIRQAYRSGDIGLLMRDFSIEEVCEDGR